MADVSRIAGGVPNDRLTLVTADQVTLRGDGSSELPLRADPQAITGVVNVQDFGAKGTWVADDTDAILEATDFAARQRNGVFGAFVYFPKGRYRTRTKIQRPNGVGFRGDNPAASMIRASDDFHDTSLVTNADQTGGQEFMWDRDISYDGNSGGGAVCSVAVVDYVSVFVTSALENVLIQNGSSVGLRIAARNALGPVMVINTWVHHSRSHNVLVEEEEGNTGGAFGISFSGIWSENCGPNSSAIYLRGRGHSAQWNLWNVHIEQGTSDAGRYGITIDGVPLVLVDGVQILRGATPLAAGVRITSNEANLGIQLRDLADPNLADPMILDELQNVRIAAANIKNYSGAGVDYQGGPRFRPAPSLSESGPAQVSLAIQDEAGVDRVQFDRNARLRGNSLLGAPLEIVSTDADNHSLFLLDNTENEVYGFRFQGNSLVLKCFTTGTDVLQIDSDGTATVLTAIKGIGDRTAPPSSGTHAVGEYVQVANPVAGGFLGWVCVVAGTPGQWKQVSAIQP